MSKVEKKDRRKKERSPSTSSSDSSSGSDTSSSDSDSSDSSASSVSVRRKSRDKKSKEKSDGKKRGRSVEPPREKKKPVTEPPSRTLFVAHIPPNVTEREISHIFRPYPGVESIRFSVANKTVCFVQFRDKEDASWAKKDLGTDYIFDLEDSEKVALRISFSNSKYSK